MHVCVCVCCDVMREKREREREERERERERERKYIGRLSRQFRRIRTQQFSLICEILDNLLCAIQCAF